MEGEPTSERLIDKSEVLETLRVKGFDDPETLALVTKWTIQQEAVVTEAGTSKATIEFNISRADLYVAGGDVDGAFECLEEARLQAYSENETELYGQIMAKMDELEGTGN